MIRRWSIILVLSGAIGFGAGSAVAQDGCVEPPGDAWSHQFPQRPGRLFQPVPKEDARYVERDEVAAIRMLEHEAIVPLTSAQAERFLGASSIVRDGGLRPYLVRAVLANANAALVGVDWSGDGLIVSTGALGCPAYVRRAVVVYLDRRPAEAFTSARSAL